MYRNYSNYPPPPYQEDRSPFLRVILGLAAIAVFGLIYVSSQADEKAKVAEQNQAAAEERWNTAETEKTDLANKIAPLQSELADTKDQLADTKQKLSLTEAHLEKANQSLTTSETEKEELAQRVEQLKRDLQQANERVALLEGSSNSGSGEKVQWVPPAQEEEKVFIPRTALSSKPAANPDANPALTVLRQRGWIFIVLFGLLTGLIIAFFIIVPKNRPSSGGQTTRKNVSLKRR